MPKGALATALKGALCELAGIRHSAEGWSSWQTCRLWAVAPGDVTSSPLH